MNNQNVKQNQCYCDNCCAFSESHVDVACQGDSANSCLQTGGSVLEKKFCKLGFQHPFSKTNSVNVEDGTSTKSDTSALDHSLVDYN